MHALPFLTSFLLRISILSASLLAALPSRAQADSLPPHGADSTRTPIAALLRQQRPNRFRPQTLLVPLALAGAGLQSLDPCKGPLNQWDTREEIQEHYPRFRTRVDDALIWVPYAGLSALLLAHVPARHEHARTVVWVTTKAALTSAILVQGLKRVTARMRPDGSARTSFPSGHTAQAFLGAAILDYEFREAAPWVGPTAYAVATSVGALRMFNNRHWQSDVLVGAALGLTVGKVTCLTHRPTTTGLVSQLTFSPTWLPGAGAGFALTWQPGYRTTTIR